MKLSEGPNGCLWQRSFILTRAAVFNDSSEKSEKFHNTKILPYNQASHTALCSTVVMFSPDCFDPLSLSRFSGTLQDCWGWTTRPDYRQWQLLRTAQGWHLRLAASSFQRHHQQLGIQALKPGFGEWKLGLRLPDGMKRGPDRICHPLRSGPWWNWCYLKARNVL